MEYIEKLIFVIIVAVLLISAVYFIFFTGEEEDTEPPEFISVTENISVMAGEFVKIDVIFSDNIEVTDASLYYHGENENQWIILSVLNGSVNISTPSNSDDDFYYYIEINDAASNGPVRSPIQNDSYYIITVTKEDDNGDDDQDDMVSSHVVFVEEGSATWCSNCPDVAEILHELFDPDNPDFYYVTLVNDKNSIAENRLGGDEFNFYGFPTVYIDGGYDVILGSDNFRSKFQQSLADANNRDVPNIYLNLTSEWNETRSELKNTVKIKNNDDGKYTGRLKIYITEITSSWRNYDNERYSYTLIDYGYNKEIELNINEDKTVSEIWEVSEGINKDNLWIMAVVFNSDSNPANSDPDGNTKPFDAYYADATHGVKVTEEISQAPPSIVITIPGDFKHYIFGREKDNSLVSKTYVIGKLTIEVDIEAEAGIDKVEYNIIGPIREFSATVSESPYSYEWDRLSLGKYTITVTLYDNDGNTATDDVEVLIFSL
ncbi:MAG: hypothetical protein LN408_00025 [Candidatus Thermoplasmatota archaeon]|nr:hypothetical protein [Candidatus Thermoplasmatota archaeon]